MFSEGYAVYVRPRGFFVWLHEWRWVSLTHDLERAKKTAESYRTGEWEADNLQTLILKRSGDNPPLPMFFSRNPKKWEVIERVD